MRHALPTAPATPDAERWQGWGTALKPAVEPICLARKPLVGTVAGNVLEWGTGALNIDGCRIDTGGEVLSTPKSDPAKRAGVVGSDLGISNTDADRFQRAQAESIARTNTLGRWPANVLLDEEAAAMLGEPARFFYVAKAPKKERPVGADGKGHPTVKPLTLMRYLVRLVTPPGGKVLDPFAGSGTTGEACLLEGLSAVLVERDAEYIPLINQRLARAKNKETP